MWLTLALVVSSGIQLGNEGVPQIKDANAYFEADEVKGDVDGVVLCRVDVVGARSWDTFSGIDLVVTLTAGDQRFEMWGPEDRPNAVVSAPGVRLAKGARVTVSVEDRDVTEREPVAHGALVFDGSKLAFNLNETQVACRTVPAARAQKRAAPYLKTAEERLTQLTAARVKLHDGSAGWPVLDEFAVDASVHDAVSWTGETAGTRAVLAKKTAAKAAFAAAVLAQAKAQPTTTTATDGRARYTLAGDTLTVEALVDHPGVVRVDVVDGSGAVVSVSVADPFAVDRLLKTQKTTLTLPPKDAVVVRAGVGADLVVLKR